MSLLAGETNDGKANPSPRAFSLLSPAGGINTLNFSKKDAVPIKVVRLIIECGLTSSLLPAQETLAENKFLPRRKNNRLDAG